MKHFFTILGLVAGATIYAQADTDIVNIPDANLKRALLTHSVIVDTNGDGEISYGEARAYKEDWLKLNEKNITNATGLEAFVNIKGLSISGNKLTSLNLSKNVALTWLDCHNNQLKSLDLSKNIALTKLMCWDNQLTSLNVSKNVALTWLECFNNRLAQLNVSENVSLEYLLCWSNQLTSLDLSKNIALKYLYCYDNKLITLDLSKNVALKELGCRSNQLTSLDLGGNIFLTRLVCFNNNLVKLNLANGNNINITTMDVLNNPNLACIKIDEGYTPTNGWSKDDTASYSTNCNYLSTQELSKNPMLKAVSPMGDMLVLVGVENISKIEIYNPAGQLVKTLEGNQRDVSTLSKGLYLLKVTTTEGTQTLKAVKQ